MSIDGVAVDDVADKIFVDARAVEPADMWPSASIRCFCCNCTLFAFDELLL